MENFVLAGKARTVFRLLELRLKYEEQMKRKHGQSGGKRENGKK